MRGKNFVAEDVLETHTLRQGVLARDQLDQPAPRCHTLAGLQRSGEVRTEMRLVLEPLDREANQVLLVFLEIEIAQHLQLRHGGGVVVLPEALFALVLDVLDRGDLLLRHAVQDPLEDLLHTLRLNTHYLLSPLVKYRKPHGLTEILNQKSPRFPSAITFLRYQSTGKY